MEMIGEENFTIQRSKGPLPLATLLASMMTLGSLGENNELLAIKAAGISLQRVLIPLGICCAVISVGAFFVSNAMGRLMLAPVF